jgi:hypothetical protein
MSDLTVERAGRRGGISALWTQPLRVPLWWRWPAAIVLALLTLPHGLTGPRADPDSSWTGALAVAQEQGLHFGRDIVFTYGPLGFLVTPSVYVIWHAVVAMIVAIVLQTLLCRTLLHASRALPVAVAVVVACIVASVPTTEAEAGLAMMLALALSLLAERAPAPRWVPAAGGAVAGLLLLVTASVGIEAFLVAGLVAVFGRAGALRSLGELVGSFFAVSVGLWLATGNELGDILPWLRGTSQFVSGYTAGMALDDPARHGEIVKALVLIVIVSLFVFRLSAGLPVLRRVALMLAWTVAGFGALKEGFVRLDGHTAIFFAMCAVAALATARGRRLRFAAAGVALLASVWSFAALGVGVPTMLDYPTRGDAFVTNLRLLASPVRRNQLLEDGRAVILNPLELPPAVVRDLRAHTVDVQPIQTSVVWALGLTWRPEPVFQSYAVLTPKLDRLNAEFLTSSRAPERILRVRPRDSIDGRNPAFDAPAAFLTTACNYREIFATKVAEVLVRSSNRCGAPRPLGGIDVRSGVIVHVPHGRKNELVYARIHITRSATEHLRELLWKPARNPGIEIGARDFRLVAATASGPLVLQIPRSAGIASSSLAAPNVRVFRLARVPRIVHIDFYAVQMRDDPHA